MDRQCPGHRFAAADLQRQVHVGEEFLLDAGGNHLEQPGIDQWLEVDRFALPGIIAAAATQDVLCLSRDGVPREAPARRPR